MVLLVTDLEPGGTPLRLARLARLLHGHGTNVHVGCLAVPGAVASELQREGIPTFGCEARAAWHLHALGRLRQHLQRIEPDLVHSTLTHANVAARLVGGSLGIPIVGSTATIERERRWHLSLERWTAGTDAAHVVGSEALRSHVVESFGLAPDSVHIVPPWVADRRRPSRAGAREQLRIDPNVFLAVWIGRFDPVKRLEWICGLAARPADADVRFALVGDGPERSPLERQLKRDGMSDHFLLPGWQADTPAWLAAADVVLCPSLTEGMPNAVLEAMAAGVPVLGSDIPALRELLGDGRGLLAATPREFAGRFDELRTDPRLRERLATAAHDHVIRDFVPERTLAAIEKVYRSVV